MKIIIAGCGKIGETTQMLYDAVTGIQWGKEEDALGWVCPVTE